MILTLNEKPKLNQEIPVSEDTLYALDRLMGPTESYDACILRLTKGAKK